MSAQLFYIGVKALIEDEKGRMLLLLADVSNHRKNTEAYWDIPGGRIEPGGNLIDTLRREINEETGLTDLTISEEQVATIISNHQIPTDSGGMAGLALVIYRISVGRSIIIKLSQEHSAYEWVNQKQARERLQHKYPQEFIEIL